MADQAKLSEMLVDLGVAKPEADVYVQLCVLAVEGSATGYQVAKALGRDPTSVYKALEELRRRGYVQTVAGRGKQYRPEDPQRLVDELARRARMQARRAKEAFRTLPRPRDEKEVYRLATRQQTIDQFRQLLDESVNVALLDLAPAALDAVARQIKAAVEREVTVVVKLYRQPSERQCAVLEGTLCIIEPDGEQLLELMPGPVMHGAFDCRAQLVTYLDRRRDDDAITQAFWTPNLFLAYQAHSGLASEIIHTALRAGIAEGMDAADLGRLNEELARAAHGPVDWEAFWIDAGFADPGRRAEARRRSKVPWQNHTLASPMRGQPERRIDLIAELLQRKQSVAQPPEDDA